MARNKSQTKARIEAKYAREERSIDGSNDRAGMMTIAFCGVGGTGDYGGVIGGG